MYSVWQVEQKVDALTLDIHGKELQLNALQVQINRSETYLKLEVSSNSEITYIDLTVLKTELEKQLNTAIRLDVTPRINL